MKADVTSALLVGTLISLKCTGRSPSILSLQAIKSSNGSRASAKSPNEGNDQCQPSHE